jgi:hypothetical protein
MISLSHLNKLTFSIIFFTILNLNCSIAEEDPVDIWGKTENSSKQINQSVNEEEKINEITEDSFISDDSENLISINETKISENKESLIGIFDPEKNNFNLNMWEKTDGIEIKKILNRIDKIKLSKISQDILFQVLFTNSYPPIKNLDSEEFLKIKINWLIKRKRIKDLETLLKTNPEVGKNSKAIKYLVNEYLSSANIKLACEKINFIDQKVNNIYLEKFKIYCLINNDRKDEAQLIFELLKERGFDESFFEDKINFLLGLTEKTSQKVSDKNLLNFYFSHITSKNFEYEPNEKTNKYIWKYLSSANLIEVNNFEDENVIRTYEQAAAEDSFDTQEIFKIYLKMNFNFNQLMNAEEIYKNLANYKARALVYQAVLLTDNIEKKIRLSFLLKELFKKDKIFYVYADEMANIMESIDPNTIPENYQELVKQALNLKLANKVKFNNDVLHRSKIIKHFLDDGKYLKRTEKDFKSVYKKIKKNKKYFISIKDIVVLESLASDGIKLPDELNFSDLSTELSVPKNLQDLAAQNQIGLVMLKIVEIIGEDKVSNLDPETIYFLNKILNSLELKKIRNNILSEALPIRV